MNEHSSRPRAILWAALTVALLLQGWGLYTPSMGGSLPFSGADKLVHVIMFAVPAALAWQLPGRFVLLGALLAHAPLSELIQAQWIRGRSGSVGDVLADGLGVAGGVILGHFLNSSKEC